MATIEKTPVSILHELATKVNAVPIYELIHSEEGTHENTYHVEVTVLNRTAIGIHSTKQGAKRNAAAELLKLIPKSVIFANNIDETKSPISLLQEYAVKNSNIFPEYQLISCNRDGYINYYTYKVTLLNEIGLGGDRRKQLAKHRAAADLLKRLENDNVTRDNNKYQNVPDFDSRTESLKRETLESSRPKNKEWSVLSDQSESPAEHDNFYGDNHNLFKRVENNNVSRHNNNFPNVPNFDSGAKSLNRETIFAKQERGVNNVIYPGPNYSKVKVSSNDLAKTSPAENKSFEYNKKKLPASVKQICTMKNMYARPKQSYSNEETRTVNSYTATALVNKNIDNRKYEGVLKDSLETSDHNKFIQFKLATSDYEGFTYECVSSSNYICGTADSKKVAKQIAAAKMLERLMDMIAELSKSKLKLTADDKELCIKRFTEIVNGET